MRALGGGAERQVAWGFAEREVIAETGVARVRSSVGLSLEVVKCCTLTYILGSPYLLCALPRSRPVCGVRFAADCRGCRRGTSRCDGDSGGHRRSGGNHDRREAAALSARALRVR